MSILTFKELKELHNDRINASVTNTEFILNFDQETGLSEIDLSNYIGNNQLAVLDKIPTNLNDDEKRIMVLSMNDNLRSLLKYYIRSLSNSTQGFELSGKLLLSNITMPALRLVNKDIMDLKDVRKANIWCIWVCIFMLTKAGWEIKEKPNSLEETVVNGESTFTFSYGEIDSVMVYLVPDKKK